MSKDSSSTQTELPSPEQLLAAIVESSDDAIIGKNLDGTITSWNFGAERLYGYKAAEVLGRSIMLIVPDDKQEEELQILHRLARGERMDHFETVRLAKGRRLVDVSLTISPIKNSAGEIIGASKIARDITERRRTERQLQDAHRQLRSHAEHLEELVAARTKKLAEAMADLETFSFSLTHDLKAPLRAIRNFAEALNSEEELPDSARKLSNRIVANAARLQQFIEDVMAYARIAGREVVPQAIRLEVLVPQVIEHYPSARHANAEVNIVQPLAAALGNESLFSQALANLVSNAVKFVPTGTRPVVTIWTELVPGETPAGAHLPAKQGFVRLYVQDNGIGIQSADIPRLFKLFTRLVSQAEYEGTGAGLAIVERAVAKMGGTVGVSSEPGKGSRFWIQLRAA